MIDLNQTGPDTTYITESWLAGLGFQWHQLARQPTKQWLLWIGHAMDASPDEIGIQVASGAYYPADAWFCWLRSDLGNKYSRFIHLRHLRRKAELIHLIEGLTDRPFTPEHIHYGQLWTPEQASRIAQEDRRLDRVLLQARPPWRRIEQDETRGGALPEHQEAVEFPGEPT